jgi:hypothetical protein
VNQFGSERPVEVSEAANPWGITGTITKNDEQYEQDIDQWSYVDLRRKTTTFTAFSY